MMHPVTNEDPSPRDWEFYPEAFKAWRAWRVVDYDGVLVLRSVTFPVTWIPKQELIAECVPIRDRQPAYHHPAPDVKHGCGIYSLRKREDAILWKEQASPTDTIVYGQVSIWGHVFQFTRGFLSEFAYPSMLYVDGMGSLGEFVEPVELCRELSKTYSIEVVIA